MKRKSDTNNLRSSYQKRKLNQALPEENKKTIIKQDEPHLNTIFYDACASGQPGVVATFIQNNLIKDLSEKHNIYLRIACENGQTEVVELLLQQNTVDPSDLDNYCIQKATENGHTKVVEMLLQNTKINPAANNNFCIKKACELNYTNIVKLLLQHKKVDPCVDKNYCIQIACANNNVTTVKLLLKNQWVNPHVNNFNCIKIAQENDNPKILSLLFNDKRMTPQYLKAAVRLNNKNNVILYLNYNNDDISNYSYTLIEMVSSSRYDELRELLFNHGRMDLSKIFMDLRQRNHNNQYTSLIKQIWEHHRFDVNCLIANCYYMETFHVDTRLEKLLFTHPHLNFIKVFEKLYLLDRRRDLKSIFLDLYMDKRISLNIIDNQMLLHKPLNIHNLILECYNKELTLTENEPLVTQLIKNDKINFRQLFEIFTVEEKSKEGLFFELYINKFLSLERIIEKRILSEPSLDLVDLTIYFIKSNVLNEDIKFREHLFNHPRFYAYENKEEWNIYNLFNYLYENSENKLSDFKQIELLIPFIKKAFKENDELLTAHYQLIKNETHPIRKQQLIYMLPISEKCIFFPQAKKNLLLPEIWDNITYHMVHRESGIRPK